MLHQDALFLPPSYKDPDFRCVNAVVKVDARGLLLVHMLVDEVMMVTFSCMSSLKPLGI